MQNKLYFGDNLQIMREYLEDQSIDLVYLDPPFNSQAQYNAFFEQPDQSYATAQASAFVDAWEWGDESETCFDEVMRSGGAVAKILQAFRTTLGTSSMMAYLAMMTPRLIEMRRLMTDSATLFLHCDPTASHYLKLILDQSFSALNFKNEIIWNRTASKSLMSNRLPANHDVLLVYGKSNSAYWNSDAAFTPYDLDNLPPKTAEKYSLVDEEGRRYQLTSLINPNQNRPNLNYEFLGVTRVWRWTRERMESAYNEGKIVQTGPGRVPRLKRYLDEQRGIPLGDVWSDISPLNSQSAERIGYPTQKPRSLLDRILSLSSKKGSTILDPFCGCGTSIEAAQALGRHWVGIDVAVHAIKVIEERLQNRVSSDLQYTIEGIPEDFASAERLAERDKYQFEWWANYLFNPYSVREIKKGADKGVDGEIYFPNGPGRKYGKIITSVKGGKKVGPTPVRELRAVVESEKAEMGLFICLHPPTKAMKEAASAGFADVVHGKMPKIQILSIQEYFEGHRPQLPPIPMPGVAASPKTRRAAVRKRMKSSKQGELLLPFSDEPFEPARLPKPKAGEVRHLNPAFKKISA